jgi:hypothetical protein
MFTIAEYMHWYVKDGNKKSFTYPTDWSGYNIPLAEIEECLLGLSCNVAYRDDLNHHDALMQGVVGLIRAECTDPAYLIGTSTETGEDVLKHEFAHALFGTNYEYEKAIRTQSSEVIGTSMWQEARQILTEKGYGGEVLLDEVQAYCVGGKDILSHLEENDRWKNFADFVRQQFGERYKE